MLGKSFLLLAGYGLLSILSMCERCPDDDYTFYDFRSLEISYPEGSALKIQDSLRLQIYETDLEYLACYKPALFPAAYALDCPTPAGAKGKKYAITHFAITSNAAWDSEHPAGSSLNDIILLNQTLSNKNTLEQYLVDEGEDAFSYGPYDLLIPPPALDKTHRFTISIEKENGETVQAVTEEIRWE